MVGLVDAHGGHLGGSEGEGKGSAFKFTLLTECAHDNHQQEANRSRR